MSTTPRVPHYIVEARARMMVTAVFFSSILYDQANLVLIPEGEGGWSGIDCPTACTDGRNLIMNLDFMKGLTVDERVFVFAHEVWHIMAMHPKRMRKYTHEGLFNMTFLPGLYNIAADAVINKSLFDSKIGKRPAGCVWIEKIQVKNGPDYVITGMETPEEIYKLLIDTLPPSTLKSLGAAGREQSDGLDKAIAGGVPGRGDGTLSGDVIPVSPDAAAEHVNEASMRSAVQSAQTQAKSQGTMPGNLKRFIDGFLEPQVTWNERLRLTIVNTSGKDVTNWSRPNKRKLVSPGVYMPKRRGLRCGPVAAAVDTSGSVSPKELQQYLGELSSILGDVRPERLWLMWCDAQVDGIVELQDPEELKTEAMVASGGGGTSFIPPFEYLKEKGIEVESMIYFTDGFGPFPSQDIIDEAGVSEVIWAISSDVVAPVGQTIRITY